MLYSHTLSKLLQWPAPSSLKQSTQLHAHLMAAGALSSTPATTHLLKSLSDPETGELSYALHVFHQISNPSTFQWNTIIRACHRHGFPKQSIQFFRRMRRAYVPADFYTFQFLFKSCAISYSILEGLAAHGLFIKLFVESDMYVASSLVYMYLEVGRIWDARMAFSLVDRKDVFSWTTIIGGLAKAGLMDEARHLFDQMLERNVVSWTIMISGYSQTGRAKEAVEFFQKMLWDGVVPDAVSVVLVLSACAQLRDLELGRWVHSLVAQKQIGTSDKLAVALVDMYSKCGDIESARRVFDSMGRKILPAWNAMIDGYCKMGDVDVARSLFNQMGSRDLVTYNCMMTGYVRHSRLEEALILFAKFRSSGLRPDKFTIVGLLTACSGLGALDQGKALHAYIEERLVGFDLFLGTSLIDMYAKCGKMDQAMLIFDRMGARDLQSWTVIIAGFAMNGKGKLALEHFKMMQNEGIRPNAVSYIAVLNACSHSGLIEEGRKHFKEMKSLHSIEAEIEHYGCMVDLLGRGGYLQEAMELIEIMPMEPNAVIWASLLCSCRVHKNVDLAEKAAKNVLSLEPHEDAAYVQLCNVYADSQRWVDASKIRVLMENRGVRKIAGYSSITINGRVHRFVAGDQSHPEIVEIQEMMNEISKRLKLAGYSPIISQVSMDLHDEEKEQALFFHSEKIAIAYGIMKLGTNLTIHVIKNLRVCEDCHSAIKLIAKLWDRDIIVRDRSRFHHFRGGDCSCNEFW